MSDRNRDSASPGFLSSGTETKRTNKNILVIILLVVASLGGVMMFGLTTVRDVKRDVAPLRLVEDENKPLAPPVEGSGLALEIPPAPEKREEPEGLKVIGPPPVDREAEARRREEDEIRRRRFERDQQAFGSNMLVRREREAALPRLEGEVGAARGAEDFAGTSGYDPGADRDKEAFFTRADTASWLSPFSREAGRRFELKTGSVIPGAMISGINSDLPGSLLAQVVHNVYDTATGRHLLVPQGSKLYGVYDSRVVYGQERTLIAWNRVIFPDGSSVTLGAMPGADISGYAGFNDQVNNHYLRIFGSAVMMSLISGGMAYTVDQTAGGSSEANTMHDEMVSALAAQLGQTTLQLLQKNLNIKPTLEIRPGYQFNIIVTKDIVFKGPYETR